MLRSPGPLPALGPTLGALSTDLPSRHNGPLTRAKLNPMDWSITGHLCRWDSPARHNGLVDSDKPGPVDRSITLGAAGADFLQLSLGDAPAGGLSNWLTGQLRQAISDGRLPVGSRLPASRVLAAELRVSRGVVTEAYRRLSEDGQVSGRGRGGTIVVAAPAPAVPALTATAALPGPTGPGLAGPDGIAGPAGPAGPVVAPGGGATSARTLFRGVPGADVSSARTLFRGVPGADVFDSLRAAPARIDLSPGVPDLAAFPRAAWLRAERAVLAGLSPADFGYGDPRGTPALRTAVANWLARTRGFRADPAEVIIVNGVAQGIGLFAQVLRDNGVDKVAVEDPGSLGLRQHLQSLRLRTVPVAVDSGGLRVDQLRASGAAAVMLTPAHQFPTGVVLDGERRRELIGWARDGGLIIEDDYDAEHRYDRPPVPAVRSMLTGQVCYVGSVSKLLAPALRVGWILPPPQQAATLVAAKRSADLGNAVLPQLILARLMESGELERQLRFLRKRHRRRRDAMIDAIAAHLPGARVHGAAAGLHLMVTFGTDFDDGELAAAALARGVKVQPLSWHRQSPGPPGLVLGYAANPPAVLTEGIATIATVMATRL
jgi:GntR family transcriptional regulator / MocR family aminotransferase